MGRPRNALAARKPSGRIKQEDEDLRDVVATQRMKHLGVTDYQSKTFLGGFLVGILFLRRRLSLHHLGHFYSFLQNSPKELRAINLAEKIQVAFRPSRPFFNSYYSQLVRHLGKEGIDVLHNLAEDRLIIPVRRMKKILEKVPITDEASAFMHYCESQVPEHYRKKPGPLKKPRKYRRFRRH